MKDGGKALYEALQAVNAKLDEEGEQLLVDLVEKVRESLRNERPAPWPYTEPGTIGQTEATLKRWIDFDAAEKVPSEG